MELSPIHDDVRTHGFKTMDVSMRSRLYKHKDPRPDLCQQSRFIGATLGRESDLDLLSHGLPFVAVWVPYQKGSSHGPPGLFGHESAHIL